jgi:5-methylcytosine-specific restriction protein B
MPRDLWCCVYPQAVLNKSYALQVTLIISAAGPEVCLCLGAGESQLRDRVLAGQVEKAFGDLQRRLGSVPPEVRQELQRGLGGEFRFRKSWRQPPGSSDFSTLDEWLAHAAGRRGGGASISRDFSVADLAGLGAGFGDVLLEAARAGAPLIEYCYGAAEPDARLAEQVRQFRAEAGYPGDSRSRREAERAGLAAALSADALKAPDAGSLHRLAGQAYGFPGRQPGYYTLLRAEDGAARIAGAFRYLLYGPGEVAGRLDDCLSGEHKLPGVGEAMLVKALAAADAGRWFPNYVTHGHFGKLAILHALGQHPAEDLTPGALALASNDQIRQLLDPYFPGDPWGVQEFAWWLLHRPGPEPPSLKALANELYLTEEFLGRALRLLDDKGQVVFYGPPGTGKTYVALQLAGYVARDDGTVEIVQFHPSYA